MPALLAAEQTVLAIDPGNFDTAYALLRGDRQILAFGKVDNEKFKLYLKDTVATVAPPTVVACEQVASYGMAVGASVFETCMFIGEYKQIVAGFAPWVQVVRLEVKHNICKSPKANDSNIRAALLDLYGPQGTKKAPGPTYGISADVWAALGLAETVRSGNYQPYVYSHDRAPVLKK